MSLWDWFLAPHSRQEDSEILMENLHSRKPITLTMDYIKGEHPKCRHLAYKLGIEFEKLLIAENYSNVVPIIKDEKDESKLEQRLENYDYNSNSNHHLFLLNQAANRIETDKNLFEKYHQMDKYSFFVFKDMVVFEFEILKKSRA